jgi:hypothetical protein
MVHPTRRDVVGLGRRGAVPMKRSGGLLHVMGGDMVVFRSGRCFHVPGFGNSCNNV